MFVGLGLSGVIPVIQGVLAEGFEALDARMGLTWVLLQGGLYIFGAFLYAVSSLLKPSFVVRKVALTLFWGRLVGRSASSQAPSTSGAALTRYFMCSWFSPQPVIWWARRRHSTSITALCAANVDFSP